MNGLLNDATYARPQEAALSGGLRSFVAHRESATKVQSSSWPRTWCEEGVEG
jgi:hypothetical protein